jgi:Protein of unknown function (DUF1579)
MRTTIAKPNLLLLATALCFTAQGRLAASQEPTAEEVVTGCAEALGGKEAWRAISTLEITGSQESFGKERPFILRRMRPDFYRLDLSEGIRPMTMAYDGQRGWWQRELLVASRGNWELPAPEVYTRAFRVDAEFEMPCLRAGDQSYVVDFLGRGELDAEPYFQLEVSLGDGGVESWYLDTESYLPVARVSVGAYWGLPIEQRTFFDDYREVAGVQIPHYVEIEAGNLHRVMNVERVEINPELDPGVFALPPPTGMEKLQDLAGRWRVEIRCRDAPEAPWQEKTAMSIITRNSEGSLLEENVAYVAAAAFPLELRRFFSYDRFREMFRIVTFDNFTSRLDVLEGILEDGELIVSNLSTNTPWSVYGNTFHSRERIYDLGPDAFKIARETSTDAGATWVVTEELSYSRASED